MKLSEPERNALIQELKEGGWRSGQLKYKLQDHQLGVYDFLTTRKGLTCALLLSRRFGKTHICFLSDVEHCLRSARSRVAYFYPTLKQGKQIITPIADIVFEDAPSGLSGVWSEQESCFTFQNGSQIFIFGCDSMRDIDRLRGNKFSSIRIDESGVHPYLKYLYKSDCLS